MNDSIEILDEAAVNRALTRISFEIVEKCDNINDLVIVGIKTRGIPMANIIKDKIFEHNNVDIPLGKLDITFYRDDLSKLSEMPTVNNDLLDIDINNKEVVLVDDVIYTGRTIRAAIEAIFKNGRPSKITLAILIDRGHRELPIKPDYVGKNVPTSRNEVIKVSMKDIDGNTDVKLFKK